MKNQFSNKGMVIFFYQTLVILFQIKPQNGSSYGDVEPQ